MKMSRKLFACLTLSLLGFAWAAHASEQSRSGPWWKNDRFQKELSLTPDQASRLYGVFKAVEPAMRAQMRALDKLEDELSNMVQEARVEEAEVEHFVARVEAARAELSKTRTLMLFRMHRILSADQNKKLQQLLDQDEKERRGRSHGPPRKQ